tara:strand:+ start:3245 stop:3718 length:474 start_codon:yes stop_codon:yes gene_type:complete
MVIVEVGLILSTIRTVSQAIEDCKSLSSMATGIDKCLTLAENNFFDENGNKKQLNLDGDESTDLKDIVVELETEKKLRAEIHRMGLALDRKFGEGSFAEVLNTRKIRLKKRAEKKEEIKQNLILQKQRRQKILIEIGKGIILIISVSGFVYFVMENI